MLDRRSRIYIYIYGNTAQIGSDKRSSSPNEMAMTKSLMHERDRLWIVQNADVDD